MSSLVEKVTVLHKVDGTADVEVVLVGQNDEPTTVVLTGVVNSSCLIGKDYSRIELVVTLPFDSVVTEQDVAAYAG